MILRINSVATVLIGVSGNGQVKNKRNRKGKRTVRVKREKDEWILLSPFCSPHRSPPLSDF